jgi:short-subunit dehydrogenase
MKSVWVVGASSGIGESLAIEYYKLGYRVFISARSGQALHDLSLSYGEAFSDDEHVQHTDTKAFKGAKALKRQQGIMVPLPMDVTDECSIEMAVSKINNITKKLHKVIINAGTCEYVDGTIVDINMMRRVFETNLFGAVLVSNLAQSLLSHNEQPQIAFVSSSVTYQALPRAHAYGGSKAALRYFVECLKADIQNQGIDVRLISPGFVKTPLTDKNDFEMPFMISSKNAAIRIIKGLNSSKFDIHFPKRFTLILKLFSILPDSLKFYLLGKLSRSESNKTDEMRP